MDSRPAGGRNLYPLGKHKLGSAYYQDTRFGVLRRIVLNQAFRKIYPALSSQIIIVMLGSAVCSQISTEELSYAANLIQSRNFRAFEAFIIATAIYLALSVGARQLLNWAGPRYFFGR